MTVEYLKDTDIPAIYLDTGTTFTVDYTDNTGEVHKLTRYPTIEPFVIDHITIVKFTNEFGFKNGIGILMGSTKD